MKSKKNKKERCKTDAKKALLNKVWSFFGGNINCIDNWGFYLFSDELNKEWELRNKIGIIWIASLLDSLEGERRFFDVCLTEAKDLNLTNVIYTLKQANVFFKYIKEILSEYTREEQIYINDMRNCLVHSWLASKLIDEVRIKYFNGVELTHETLSRVEYHKIIRDALSNFERTPDEVMRPLVDRFKDRKHKYWQVVEHLAKPGWLNLLMHALNNGQIVKIKGIDVSL